MAGGRRSARALSAGEGRATADARAVIRCSALGGAEARPPARRFVSLARAAAAAVFLPGISSSLCGAKQQFSKVFAVLGALPPPSKTRFAKLTVLRRDALCCICAAAPCSLAVLPALPAGPWRWSPSPMLGRLRAAETPSLTHPSPLRGAYRVQLKTLAPLPGLRRGEGQGKPFGRAKKRAGNSGTRTRPRGPASTCVRISVRISTALSTGGTLCHWITCST